MGVSLVPNNQGTRRRDDWTKKHAMDPPSIEFNNRVVPPRMEEIGHYFVTQLTTALIVLQAAALQVPHVRGCSDANGLWSHSLHPQAA